MQPLNHPKKETMKKHIPTTQIIHRPCRIAFIAAACICAVGTAKAQFDLLNVKIGTDTLNGGANASQQQEGAAVLGTSSSWWNDYAYVSSTPYQVSVVDGSDVAISGVTLTVQNSGGVGSKSNSGSNPAFLYASEPYQNPGGIFTITLSGLSASTAYEFVGYAGRPNSSSGTIWSVTDGTLDSGTTMNTGASVDITAGNGVAYSQFYATSDANGNLVVTDTGNGSSAITTLAGFQMTPVAVLEPALWGGLGAGLVAMLGLKRRIST